MPFVNKMLFQIRTKFTDRVLHEEELEVDFPRGESRWLRGQDRIYYWETSTIEYWVRNNGLHYLYQRERTQNCPQELVDLYNKVVKEAKESTVIDVVTVDTLAFRDDAEFQAYVKKRAETGVKGLLFQGVFD